MARDFWRMFRTLFIGAVLLASPPPAPGRAYGPADNAGGQSGPWWEVRLTVAATGRYSLRGDGPTVTGEYVVRARWEGRLESEADDFLLVHLKTELLEWRLREASGSAGTEATREAPASPKPALRLLYVLKDGHDVEFAFELGEIAIPLRPSSLRVPLELPRSFGRDYGAAVCRGSNRVVVPEAEFLRGVPERRFAWDWRHVRPYFRRDRVFFMDQSHTAEANVVLVRH
jgi:hypothetical protein